MPVVHGTNIIPMEEETDEDEEVSLAVCLRNFLTLIIFLLFLTSSLIVISTQFIVNILLCK